MDKIDRVLGRLEEFKRLSEKRFDQLERKVDELREFRWRVAGGAAALSILLTVVLHLFDR